MTQFLRRRWPIVAGLCLLLCGAALPLAGAPAPPEKDEVANSIGMKLKLIKPGKFLMGSRKEDGAYDIAGPQHKVELTRPFYLGICPVTKRQFTEFVKDDGYLTEAERAGEKETWRDPGFEAYDQTDDDPAVCISWNDAVKFCDWLSKKEKKPYTLPTEAQWEYSCRAGTTTIYPIRDDDAFDNYVWYQDNSKGHTHPVGANWHNPWGLYDMPGNVRQWCQDGYGPYSSDDLKDPQGDNKADCRVLRGASWCNPPGYCLSACRSRKKPAYSSNGYGFRVCLALD